MIPGVGGLSASLGVAVYPDDAIETDQLVREADLALHLAGNRGRSRTEAAAEGEQAPARRRSARAPRRDAPRRRSASPGPV